MRPRFTASGFAYKHKSQKATEQELDGLLGAHKPDQPLQGSLLVSFAAFMPIPASMRKHRRAEILARETAHIAKPDLDNLAKQLKDAMTRLRFWHDDRQVAALACKKVYGASPRWDVAVLPWEER